MPIQKNGTTVEYQSVRYKPNPDYIKRAEPLYKRLREGRKINQNIVNISEVADMTSQGAQQSVEATEEMIQTIQNLDSLVLQFMKRDT